MLRIWLLLIILISGVVLGPLIAGHQGYVLIQTSHYNIETSVTGLVLMIFLLIVGVLCLTWLLRRLNRMGSITQGWFRDRKHRQARKQTQAGLLKLAERDYQQVETLLTRYADHAEQPVINYLLAAEAAQKQGDALSVNQYLQRATELAGDNQLAVDITRTRLQLAQGEVDAAKQSIDQLLDIAPRHPEVLRLAEQAYLRSGASDALLDIIPAMRKIHLYDENKLLALAQQAHISLMQQAMDKGGSKGLKIWWQQQNRKIRHDVAIQYAMVKYLLQYNEYELSQHIVVDSLKRHVDDRLLAFIGQIKSGDTSPLQKALRDQIRQQGATPPLSAALSRLLQNHGEWQKAYEILQQSLIKQPDPENYAAIANVLEKLNRYEEAAEMRREGLVLAQKETSGQK